MQEVEEYCPINQQEWREWLEKNHLVKDAVWLIFYKKKSPNYNLSWSESVDQALCFGWIDSTKKSLDAERFIQYFSKRKPTSIWSKVNKDKIDHLTSTKQMRAAGFKTVEVAKANDSWSILDEAEALITPDILLKEFNERPGSLDFYESLSNSAKKMLLVWIALAKRPETKLKRSIEIAENASNNLKPKQFR
jgi:uncharacterized protein YdeI (YjbR/CyaY-like superfamily)